MIGEEKDETSFGRALTLGRNCCVTFDIQYIPDSTLSKNKMIGNCSVLQETVSQDFLSLVCFMTQLQPIHMEYAPF